MVALSNPLSITPSVDVLALVQSGHRERLPAALFGLRLHWMTTCDEFVRRLGVDRPRVVLLGAPPADLATIEAVAAVRRRRPGLRCVLLNARAGVQERLHALDLGYDAALPVGTSMLELGGRVAILARAGAALEPARTRIPIGDGTQLDLVRACLLRDGRPVHLRPKEFHLLETLGRHPGRIYSRGELLDRVWGPGREGNPRTVDVHIRWLRAKIERVPGEPLHIVTVRGRGYRLEPEAVP